MIPCNRMLGPTAPRLIRMLRPTDSLRADHALTAAALRSLQIVADRVRAGARFPAADCALLLRFLREFVLAVHLRKESDWIWPAVAMRGEERAAELVGELLRAHESLTDLVHALVMFWDPSDLSPAERAGFADTVEALCDCLRRMQQIEEQELFPACDAAVPADDQIDWLGQFDRLEAERGTRALWAERLRPAIGRWSH